MNALLDTLFAAFPLAESLKHLARLTAWDRFQASHDIVEAAHFVGEVLDGRGLSDVSVHHIACPARWWTFDGPQSWTPVSALLRTGGQNIVRYPDDALCLATNSAASQRRFVALHPGCRGDVRDKVVVLEQSDFPGGITAVERSGAVGILMGTSAADQPEARARLELPNGTGLFGFSLTSAELALVRRFNAVEVEIETATGAPMPLVEARLPGFDDAAEILVQAHLCHPRPGANDNCSGVAAALGLAAALRSLPGQPRRGVRFLFAPEFVGTAAFLHDFVQTGRRQRPIAAVNLDMVGEDQSRCGGPLTVELPPDHMASPLGAISEHMLMALPHVGRTYSGSLPARNWNAIATPFAGASDHAIFADRSVAIPAIMIGHWPDRFNHTSFDTIDKVDAEELRRAAILAGGCAWTMATADQSVHRELEKITVHHVIGRLLAAARSPGADRMLLDHIATTGYRQLDGLERLTGGRSSLARRTIAAQTDLLCQLHDLSAAPDGTSRGAIVRTWPGPFNLRGLLRDATGAQAHRVRRRIASDRSAYACVLALAHAIDDSSGRGTVLRRAACSSMLSIDADFAEAVFDTMAAAGWTRELAA